MKPVLPRPMSNGKLPTEKQLAFLISRKIATVGIEPKPMLKKTLDQLNGYYIEMIKDAIAEDVQKAIIFTY